MPIEPCLPCPAPPVPSVHPGAPTLSCPWAPARNPFFSEALTKASCTRSWLQSHREQGVPEPPVRRDSRSSRSGKFPESPQIEGLIPEASRKIRENLETDQCRSGKWLQNFGIVCHLVVNVKEQSTCNRIYEHVFP